jgi:hypothetical protein
MSGKGRRDDNKKLNGKVEKRVEQAKICSPLVF